MRTIKELREAARITQKELAGILGVSPYAVRSWEQSSYPPTESIRIRICEFFDVKSTEVDWPSESYGSDG